MNSVQPADTAFVLVSAALVLLMTPGLAMFYAGMVRSKNALGTIIQSFILISVITIEWIYIGYTMAFGPDFHGITGDLSWFALSGVGQQPSDIYAVTVPHMVFMIYQCMFAVITPALITGAFAERMRFGPFILFSLLWSVCVYNPVCHWVWGSGGWLSKLGVLDFAGGLVVHLTCGVAALASAMVIGSRKGYGSDLFMPHNLPLTLLGTGLLWFGWFGFNGGSALAANGLAASAFVATHFGGMSGLAAWVMVEWLYRKKPTTLGAASGAVAGLATITPASGFVSPIAAVLIGGLGGLVCFFAVSAKARLGYDDSLDVVGIHGVGGLLGTVCVGLFASSLVNPAGADGLFLGGGPGLLMGQMVGVVSVGAYAFAVSWILLKVIDTILGMRINEESEHLGLDLTEHSESAYSS